MSPIKDRQGGDLVDTGSRNRAIKGWLRILLGFGGAAAGVWYECSREHPIQDGLKRLDHRLKHDKRFKEQGAILVIEARMLGRSEALVIEALGQPSSVRCHLRNGVVTRAMTFPPFPGWTQRFQVQCVDGTVRSFNPLLD